MNISPDDLVVQILANLQCTSVAEAIEELHPVIQELAAERIEVQMADAVNGLRTGTLADVTVIRKMQVGTNVSESVREVLLPVLHPLGVREFTLLLDDESRIGCIDFPNGGFGTNGPYGIIMIAIGAGVDPYHPEEKEQDRSRTSDAP